MLYLLKVEAGSQSGRTIRIDEGETAYIGRDKGNEYRIPSPQASKVHAKIENRNGTLVITDLGSKNGTRVNGKEINAQPLRHDDVIEIARCRLRIIVEEPARPDAGEKDSEPLFGVPKPSAARPALAHTQTVGSGGMPSFSEEEQALVGHRVADMRIISTLYAGRRSRVYKATQSAANRVVALTMIPFDLVDDRAVVKWFVQGARRAGGLKHEDVVPLVKAGNEGKIYYMVTLLMEQGNAAHTFHPARSDLGSTVMDKARHGGKRISLVKKALQSVIHMTRALEFALQKNVLHLGVRPTKVLFNEYAIPRLSGLGFDNGPGPGMAPEGGMQPYLAPEQQRAPGRVAHTTDIYGLGGTFYYMLTGRAPQRNRRGRLKPVKELNPIVPDSLCRIVEKMLEQSPDDRYLSYGHLLHDSRWAMRGEEWPHEPT